MSEQRPSDLASVAKVSDHTQKLAEKLQKAIIRKSKKRKIYSTFMDKYLRSRSCRYAINT